MVNLAKFCYKHTSKFQLLFKKTLLPKAHKGTYEPVFSCNFGEISQGSCGAKRHRCLACW